MPETSAHLRIGELARRVGVTPELLRAWERRYGLTRPARSEGGFRLYSSADEARLRLMKEHLASGLSAAEAARAALAAQPGPGETAAASAAADDVERLRSALEAYDDVAAHALFDRLLATYSTATVLRTVVLPLLRVLGERWQAGEVTVAQEHFASHVLRGRLLGLARDWGTGAGPIALLACPPGEQHDIPLIVFGLSLRSSGWRIAFLGADTPLSTLEEAVESLRPAAVVLNAVGSTPFRRVEAELEALARRTTVALGGAGAEPDLAERVGAVCLAGDPVSAASAFAAGRR